MPEPAAMYMSFPVGASFPFILSALSGATAGRLLFVSIVAELLMMPKASAMPT